MLCVLAGILSVILLTDFLQDAKESTAIPKVNILIFIENKPIYKNSKEYKKQTTSKIFLS
jgi:hypothetical protein